MRNIRGYTLTGYKRYIYRKEIKLILNTVKKYDLWYLLFHILAYIGLRCNEVVRLKYDDILGNYERLRVTLNKQGGRVIERAIPNKVKDLLREYVKNHKEEGHEYLFYSDNNNSKGKHIKESSVRWKITKIRFKLGLTDIYRHKINGQPQHRVSTHAFRHFFLTEVYNKSGKDLVLTSRIIGHKNTYTTERYISIVDKLQKELSIVNLI